MARATSYCRSLFILACAVAAGSCSGTHDGSSPQSSGGNGQLSVNLVDAPNTAVKQIVVTVVRVTAHSNEAGWVTLMSGSLTVDLLQLQSYVLPLGFATLPSGHVTQIRLYTDPNGPQYVTLPDGTQVALKVPSGPESGIKIMGPFEISACNLSAVTLDFDGHKSIWVHPTGQGDEWILRPVIRVKGVDNSPIACPDAGSSSGNPGGVEGGGTADAGSAGSNGGGGADAGGSGPGGSGDKGADAGSAAAGGGGGADGGSGCFAEDTCTPCVSGNACLSGVCSNGVCAPGGVDTPCNTGADCLSGSCVGGVCTAPTGVGGAGAPCTQPNQCLSNSCSAGTCQPGQQGAPCNADSDCMIGETCASGVCTTVLL